jgi:hypothetical protein
MALFDTGPNVDTPTLIPAQACDAQPGDEVVCLNAGGDRMALRVEYVVMSPDRSTVTLVPRDAGEITVGHDHPVMLVRGTDEAWVSRQAMRPEA